MGTGKIAEKLGCSPNHIWRQLKKWGVPTRNPATQYWDHIRVPTDPVKLAYIAGILDGEGSIFLRKDPPGRGGLAPTTDITNTDRRLIDWLLKELGGHYQTKTRTPKEKNWKTCYYWRTQNTLDIHNLLKAVLPYLIIKRKNAEKVFQFCEWRLAQRRSASPARSSSGCCPDRGAVPPLEDQELEHDCSINVGGGRPSVPRAGIPTHPRHRRTLPSL